MSYSRNLDFLSVFSTDEVAHFGLPILVGPPKTAAVGGSDVDVQTLPGDEEVERLRQLISARFGGQVRDFMVLVRSSGFVLQGRTGSFDLKQMVGDAVVGATAFQVVANEIAVNRARPVGRPVWAARTLTNFFL